MSEATAVLESSSIEAAAVPPPVMEVSRGPLVDLTPEQRKEYKTTGNLPKPAASAPAPAQGESETPPKQVVSAKPKPSAEERIAQLESTIEKIKAGAGLNKPKPAESAPAQSEPVAPQFTRPKPTSDDKNPDGSSKYATHEEFEDAKLDWMFEQKEVKKASEAREAAQISALDAKIEKARSRYENLDEVVTPAADAIIKDSAISPVIKQMLYDSEITPDLIFTLASNKEEFSSFLKMAKENPGKAIRYVALTESLIAQELEAKAAPVVEPAKPRTQAPKPPAEAGGRAATPPDSMQAALEASGGKLNAGLKAEFLRRDLARLKG